MNAELETRNAEHPQRTLLPYRLAREAAAQEIRDEINWLTAEDAQAVESAIEALERTADWREGHLLYVQLRELMNRDTANSLVGALLTKSKAVWLFEREYRFDHGIALVPVSRFASFAPSRDTIPAGGAA